MNDGGGGPIPFGRAYGLASTAIREVRRANIGVDALMVVGDVRRYEPAVRTISLLGVAPVPEHDRVMSAVSRLPFVVRSERIDSGCATIFTERGELTLHVAAPENAGAALVWHTGSRSHVDVLEARAAERGLRLADGRLSSLSGVPVSCPSEVEFYRRMDLPFIAPELRDGADEFAAAESQSLPELITEIDIRGDLHTHSVWSDGRDSIEYIALSARQLGYEYIAITDHSQRAHASRTLSIDDVSRQRDEIASLREKIRGIDILHGTEVDILPDGTLDFDDELLERFDIVLASLHVRGGQEAAQLTERYLRAIEHPFVNIITHPANRSPARSQGLDVDFASLFAAAAETGTAMEIDGAPSHLDMDGALARHAVAAGATVTIDSDCHRAEWLARQMRFGVGTARRGWIESRHVLNTRSADEVRAFVARKRARRG